MDSEGFVLVGKNKRVMAQSHREKSGTSKTQRNISLHTNQINDDKHLLKKRILCQGMINTGHCSYGSKCTFAHTLDEQHIDPIRKRAYDIIKSSDDLSHIKLSDDEQLFNQLIILSRTCLNCVDHKCLGGYNCNKGAINNEYVVCYKDLVFGNCFRDNTMNISRQHNCQKIHLTERGLKCKNYEQFGKKNECKNNTNNTNNTNINVHAQSESYTKNSHCMHPILCTSPHDVNNEKNLMINDSSDGESIESLDSMIEYNEDDDCSECSDCVIILK